MHLVDTSGVRSSNDHKEGQLNKLTFFLAGTKTYLLIYAYSYKRKNV